MDYRLFLVLLLLFVLYFAVSMFHEYYIFKMKNKYSKKTD